MSPVLRNAKQNSSKQIVSNSNVLDVANPRMIVHQNACKPERFLKKTVNKRFESQIGKSFSPRHHLFLLISIPSGQDVDFGGQENDIGGQKDNLGGGGSRKIT